jgi:hypothetical protein
MPDSLNDDRKMTVMCFFASDNALSPLLISQLKAIKDAGYEQDTDVLVRFDPNEEGVPTRIYHVNDRRRGVGGKKDGRLTSIGDGPNPFVRNLAEDIIDPDSLDISKAAQRDLKAELTRDDNVNAVESLTNFVNFCRESYPAKHYILFLIGHGMIVGNDAFLPDDNPTSGISLADLGSILKPFREGNMSSLELLGLHSCSMASVEIAYQLKGLANHMIASQGTSYVGSWPYRQLLKKIFATVDEANRNATEIDVQQLVEKLYHLSLYNSTDLMMAGYCSEMSLCNLQEDIVAALTEPLQTLVELLTGALRQIPAAGTTAVNDTGNVDPVKDPLIVNLISKAHAESQSYWGESYTDLHDFCERLEQACLAVTGVSANATLAEIAAACKLVKTKLETVPSEDRSQRFQNLVVRSEYFGWKFQYSYGLSIYFPWAEPLEIENVPTSIDKVTRQSETKRYGEDQTPKLPRSIMERYKEYEFNRALNKGASWFDFLNSYFKGTERALRNGTPPPAVLRMLGLENPSHLAHAATSAAALSPDPNQKTGGEQGPTARGIEVDGDGSSIKNFHTTLGRRGRKIRAFSISPGALKAFKEPVPKDANTKVAGQGAD